MKPEQTPQAPQAAPPIAVTVTDIDIPIESLVWLIVKFALAAIPVAIAWAGIRVAIRLVVGGIPH